VKDQCKFCLGLGYESALWDQLKALPQTSHGKWEACNKSSRIALVILQLQRKSWTIKQARCLMLVLYSLTL